MWPADAESPAVFHEGDALLREAEERVLAGAGLDEALLFHLAKERVQGAGAHAFQQAVGAELVQPSIDDFLGFAADEHLDDAAFAKTALPAAIAEFGGHSSNATESLS